jgi:hypothetical protein
MDTYREYSGAHYLDALGSFCLNGKKYKGKLISLENFVKQTQILAKSNMKNQANIQKGIT